MQLFAQNVLKQHIVKRAALFHALLRRYVCIAQPAQQLNRGIFTCIVLQIEVALVSIAHWNASC